MFRLLKWSCGCLAIPVALLAVWFLFSADLLYVPHSAEVQAVNPSTNEPSFEIIRHKRWEWVPGANEVRVELPREEWELIAATGEGPGFELLLSRSDATWENLGTKEATEGAVRNVQLLVELILRF